MSARGPARADSRSTVLWNWALKEPALGQVVDNYRILTTFSNTRTEERFYEVPCNMEALGAPVLRTMAAILDEAFLNDAAARRKMSVYLVQLATLIGRIADVFPSFLPECDPNIFYHEARPWFHGGPRRFVVAPNDFAKDHMLAWSAMRSIRRNTRNNCINSPFRCGHGRRVTKN